MKKGEVSIIIFIYNSYKDPLFQNLLLEYIKTLSNAGEFNFQLITFEQEAYRLNDQEVEDEKQKLLAWNIHWHPRKFHTGRFLLFKKLYDVLNTIFSVIKIKIKTKPSYIFAFANVSAAMSVIFSRTLNLKLVIYSYEPHSEFMKDLGIWSANSLKYKILRYFEHLAAKKADHVMTGTKYGLELLTNLKSKAKTYRAPTSVNPNEFKFKPSGRSLLRDKLNIQNKVVYLYLGKFGGLYYTEEIIDLFKGIYDCNKDNSYFLIVSSYDHDIIDSWFKEREIPKTAYHLTKNISNEDVKVYISTADMGISAVPPSPAQKYRSPTKVAEYLLCGLPYITCSGISEDDEYAIDKNVGAVVNSYSYKEGIDVYPKVELLLSQNRSDLRDKCRAVGLSYRSKDRIDEILKEIFLTI